MKRFVRTAIAALALAASQAFAATPPAYYVNPDKLRFDPVQGIETERSWGVHNGAGYRMEKPANWNGRLVMWAHGYRGTGLELTVDSHPLRAWLVANGYAWAASSYSRNAYDPSQGAKDTHALTMLFNGKYGKPQRTYISGVSMGGHVTGLVAEQYRGSYDGAMPLCPVLGDYELFDYFLDFNLAAQTLSGMNQQFPFGDNYLGVVVPGTKAALGPAFPYLLNAQGQALAGLTMMRSGGARPLFPQAFIFWNGFAGDFLFGLGTGNGTLPRQPGMALQNSDVVYQLDADPALSSAELAFNASVQRLTADPQARRRNGLANVAPTTGDLKIPMLTVHNLGDLFVPLHMQQVYAQRVAAKGNSGNLVQRVTREVQHCGFTATELVQTFTDLVKWVENGVKPGGDDVNNPAALAQPTFGCTYTDKAVPRVWDSPAWVFPKPAVCPNP